MRKASLLAVLWPVRSIWLSTWSAACGVLDRVHSGPAPRHLKHFGAAGGSEQTPRLGIKGNLPTRCAYELDVRIRRKPFDLVAWNWACCLPTLLQNFFSRGSAFTFDVAKIRIDKCCPLLAIPGRSGNKFRLFCKLGGVEECYATFDRLTESERSSPFCPQPDHNRSSFPCSRGQWLILPDCFFPVCAFALFLLPSNQQSVI
jgi:hypothetical protein